MRAFGAVNKLWTVRKRVNSVSAVCVTVCVRVCMCVCIIRVWWWMREGSVCVCARACDPLDDGDLYIYLSVGCILVRDTAKKQKSAKQNEATQTSSFLTISHRTRYYYQCILEFMNIYIYICMYVMFIVSRIKNTSLFTTSFSQKLYPQTAWLQNGLVTKLICALHLVLLCCLYKYILCVKSFVGV